MKKVLVGLSILLLMSGCGGAKAPQQVKQDKVKSSVPAWINNADLDGNVGAVGIVLKAKIKNPKKRLYIAKKLGIAALQERKSAFVSSSLDRSTKVVNGKVKKELNQKINISSSSFATENIVVKDTYVDDKNLYVWGIVGK